MTDIHVKTTPQQQPGPCIQTRREGAVGIIEFDNPAGGFLTAGMVQATDRVTREWELDPGIRAIVLTGKTPGTFITHYSPHEIVELADKIKRCKSDRDVNAMRRQARWALRTMQLASRIAPLYRWLNKRFGGGELKPILTSVNLHQMLSRWQRSSTIFIAAINGYAMGGGFELALACDFRLMSRGEHVLGLPESVSGIIPGAGGTQRLARLVGPQQAVAMIITGEMSNADDAERKGLISRAVDADQLFDEAMSLAQQMAGQPPLSLGGVKRAVHDGIELPIERALELEALLFMDVTISRDAVAMGSYYLEHINAGGKPIDAFRAYSKGHVVTTKGH